MSEKPAEIPVPEETTEKTTELNSDALLSLPPQPKVTCITAVSNLIDLILINFHLYQLDFDLTQFTLISPRTKRRTLQRQQNVPPNLKSAKAIMAKAAEQGREMGLKISDH